MENTQQGRIARADKHVAAAEKILEMLGNPEIIKSASIEGATLDVQIAQTHIQVAEALYTSVNARNL